MLRSLFPKTVEEVTSERRLLQPVLGGAPALLLHYVEYSTKTVEDKHRRIVLRTLAVGESGSCRACRATAPDTIFPKLGDLIPPKTLLEDFKPVPGQSRAVLFWTLPTH